MMRPRACHFLLLAIAGLLLARIPFLPRREFDPDELEHSHAAWLMFKGMVPYKDFFEHHTPWYYYALRPFFNLFDVDTSFESARHFLLLGRWLSFILTIASIGLVVAMGRLWADQRTGLLAGLLLVAQPIFFQKTIEMRPDVLALPFFLGALACLLRGLGPGADSLAPRLRWFVAGGLAAGAAIMCTQKALFVLPGVLAGLGLWALSDGAKAVLWRSTVILVFLLAVCVPGTLTWAAFALQHAGGEFITSNFLLNARWKPIRTGQLSNLLVTSGPVLALALLGLGAGLRKRNHQTTLLATTVIGLFAALVVLPAAHRQYYLLPLPIVCLFAAQGLFILVERIKEPARAWFIAVAAMALAVEPAKALYWAAFHEPNDQQLARLSQVYETTTPTDLVMDGWQGMGVFRRNPFYYFFLHDEMRTMLPREQLDAYLDDLESGRVRPRLIVMDHNLRDLDPRFVAFVEKNYVTRDGYFYFSR